MTNRIIILLACLLCSIGVFYTQYIFKKASQYEDRIALLEQSFGSLRQDVLTTRDAPSPTPVAQSIRTNAGSSNDEIEKYKNIVRENIYHGWRQPVNMTTDARALVLLRLQSFGDVRILEARILNSSGDEFFNSTVLKALEFEGSFKILEDIPSNIFVDNFSAQLLIFKPGSIEHQ